MADSWFAVYLFLFLFSYSSEEVTDCPGEIFLSLCFLRILLLFWETESTRQKHIKLGISWQVYEDLVVTFCATSPRAHKDKVLAKGILLHLP